MMRVGFLHSLIRPEEKFLLRAFQSRPDIELVQIDDRALHFDVNNHTFDLDVVLNRSINHSRALNAIKLFESYGVKCINSATTVDICGDKLATSIALRTHAVPQPEVRVAFSEKAALRAMEEMGFPVVLKPAVGSWGRLLSKINDRETALTILEHRKVLGSYNHTIYYIQKYVEKKGRDIRSLVVGSECLAASYRESEHWITNAARGGRSTSCPISPEIREISLQAAGAVNGAIVGIDLFETADGIMVNEVNHTMEFKSIFAATGCDIPGHIIDFVAQAAAQSATQPEAVCVDCYS